MGGLDRDEVMGWVRGYELGWRAGQRARWNRCSPRTPATCFPYEEPLLGHQAIRDFWLADEGEAFTMTAGPVAVDGNSAVVRVEVRYGEPFRQEYRDLWLLTFADDGRVEEFEEWAYWPGKPYTSAED